ncbi:protein PSK SIMULATOR 1-like [Lycium barbarum]|uniref:protein PSK SIMULATOR 1-like n=1 Tax=Lycium barbarum TaxID=112863 RepID=UPI00293F715A|nr:protein PSK SIMULATOR 1-like [Lycium barbarum]XP_060201325.1 protein PSK SIMULATOR 1-like [Lycium barbarum]XP_060201326.1 protein PSK SIMULATOR 1-like [Lycium barbarum]
MMGVETVTESFFNLWRSTSRKSSASEPERKHVIGILALEIATLMSKVVNLWQCLSERRIDKLREEISSSLGIQKLVAEDDEYLMDLAIAEIIDNLGCLTKSLATLGKRCADPVYHDLERIFEDPVEIEINGCAWRYRIKKMERKVKKMERFVAATTQLYSELEVLAELEQTLRRMQAGASSGQMKLLEFRQKVIWQREEVKNLREMSPWVRTYDYTVRLLLRSIFTIIMRIKYLFGTNQTGVAGESNHFDRSRSISALNLSSVYPSENNASESYLGSLGRSFSSLGLSGGNKDRPSNRKSLTRQSTVFCGKPPQVRSRRFANVGPFKGCINSGTDSPVLEGCMPSNSDLSKSDDSFQKDTDSGEVLTKASLFNFKRKLLIAPQDTLGYAALTLKYANIIILIEKLGSAPHLISLDARDDLYNMLPASIRNSLRLRLKVFAKSVTSSIYDNALASEWSLALGRILEWLSPLAHNTIRWHSERNFEKQRLVYGANVLLVQTLYFANQARTEAAVIELLMGLNYLSRFGREVSAKPLMETSCGRASSEYFLHKDNNPSTYHMYHD